MANVSVKAEYKNGVVTFKEPPPDYEHAEVLVVFPDKASRAPFAALSSVFEELERQHPEVLLMTPEERKREFDEISAKAAERMPYRTYEEFDQAMRGDEFGLT